MLSASIAQELSNLRLGIERLSGGESTDAREISLSRRSCALRVALPSLLLLSSFGLRNCPSYVGTGLAMGALGGTLLFADKIGPKKDQAILGLQAGLFTVLVFDSSNYLFAYLVFMGSALFLPSFASSTDELERVARVTMAERSSFLSSIPFLF